MVDDLDEPIIEIRVRVAESFIGRLEQGVESLVGVVHGIDVRVVDLCDPRVVARVARDAEHDCIVTIGVRVERFLQLPDRANLVCDLAARQVVDRRDEPVDHSLAHEQRLEGRAERVRNLEQEVSVAVIERGQLDQFTHGRALRRRFRYREAWTGVFELFTDRRRRRMVVLDHLCLLEHAAVVQSGGAEYRRDDNGKNDVAGLVHIPILHPRGRQ